jgi:hypothetical protein
MTYTITNFPMRDRWNDRVVREVRAAGPVSYTTGGDPVQASELGLGDVFGVYGVLTNGSAVVIASFDYTNQKVLFFVPNTGAQVANAVDLSAFTGTLLFTGKD